MVSMKMRMMFVSLVVLGALYFYSSEDKLTPITYSLNIESNSQRNNQRNNEKRDFLQLPELDCEQSPPFLVLLVASAQEQVLARSVIRSTWGRKRLVRGRHIQTLFLLGTSPNKHLSEEVSQESQQYRDIIQKDFVDVYSNLTLKTLMGMEWVQHFCPQVTFVMKTDTDTFVNVYYLTDLLLQKNRTTKFFTGFLKMKEFPIRNQMSKWFVSREEYPRDKYPPFCSGSGYVFSSDISGLVHNVSQSIPFLKLEDVFVGLCLEQLNITPEPLHSENTFFPIAVPFSICRFKKIVTSHYVKPKAMSLYWYALERSLGEECPAA